ncbi:unnamed protein product, partial [Ectocarpus sp. 12 AP-2014]
LIIIYDYHTTTAGALHSRNLETKHELHDPNTIVKKPCLCPCDTTTKRSSKIRSCACGSSLWCPKHFPSAPDYKQAQFCFEGALEIPNPAKNTTSCSRPRPRFLFSQDYATAPRAPQQTQQTRANTKLHYE